MHFIRDEPQNYPSACESRDVGQVTSPRQCAVNGRHFPPLALLGDSLEQKHRRPPAAGREFGPFSERDEDMRRHSRDTQDLVGDRLGHFMPSR